jgi:hypothetical protein
MREKIAILFVALVVMCASAALADPILKAIADPGEGSWGQTFQESASGATTMTFKISSTSNSIFADLGHDYALSSGWTFSLDGSNKVLTATGAAILDPITFNLWFEGETFVTFDFEAIDGDNQNRVVDCATVDFDGTEWKVSDPDIVATFWQKRE